MHPKINLLGLSKNELSLTLNRLGVEKKELSMRVQQLFSWIHVHGKKSFNEMTNLSKEFRSKYQRKKASVLQISLYFKLQCDAHKLRKCMLPAIFKNCLKIIAV